MNNSIGSKICFILHAIIGLMGSRLSPYTVIYITKLNFFSYLIIEILKIQTNAI